MNRFFLGSLIFIILGLTSCQDDSARVGKEMETLMTTYSNDFQSFNISTLQLSYLENLKRSTPLDSIEIQVAFFESFQKKLQGIDFSELDINYRSDYRTLEFETKLHLERLELEKSFWETQGVQPLDKKKIYFILNGKNWYRYFIKRWVGADVTPQELEKIGLSEIDKIQTAIRKIQQDLKFENDALGFYEHLNKKGFFEKKSRLIRSQFKERQAKVRQQIWSQFKTWPLPLEKIKKGNNQSFQQVPGFYDPDQQTFFFNLFDQPYNVRQMDWLYLHEVVPGHHFQMSFEDRLRDSLPAYRASIPFNGYREGWGAYAEEIGAEVGLYEGLYDLMGKYEWDLVRAVRMVLDVKLNFYGWSDEKAISFWNENIDNQDDIAIREIERMKKWPAQVQTYKYGALQILKLKKDAKRRLGSDFDIKKFHDQILRYGPLHWQGVKEQVVN